MILTRRQYLFLFFFILSVAFVTSCSNESSKGSEEEQGLLLEENDHQVTKEKDEKTIVFFGNSLTAGYGLELTQAFPALIQEKINALGMSYNVINAGLSGETTASGNTRIDWVLRQEIDIFILELGGNDGLRGIKVSETKKNLQQIIDKVGKKYPEAKIVLAGMQIPPNMGADYTTEFKGIFEEIANKNELALIPFLLENVGGIPSLNQPDGIHPTEEGHKIIAENVWKILEPIL
ncbi:arylesterase [Fulvivirgaceae bacterium BMA10]|uniref:Arylesterase n=1 Tax=Splendidivirga corallicola TaxID=3051826 RepID=A0ABT8KGU4_9BACT|nr:arylesterase [Fulvivirgaceae bacterium BMA10]